MKRKPCISRQSPRTRLSVTTSWRLYSGTVIVLPRSSRGPRACQSPARLARAFTPGIGTQLVIIEQKGEWNLARFGPSLEVAHQGVACRTCSATRSITAPAHLLFDHHLARITILHTPCRPCQSSSPAAEIRGPSPRRRKPSARRG